MDIKTFKAIAHQLPSDITLLLRGATGIGKSFLGKAIARHHDLPFIDVRLSVMSEGDMAGYPDLEGMKKNGIMTMCMPSWFMRACKEPVVLMLDELNRALPGVQQAAFQLVLDRELGNDEDGVPYRLHPQTRIVAAVNAGAEYDVNEMDPALLRRFWTVDIDPTTEDWLEWAGENDIDRVLMEFIRQNPAHLRVDPTEVEPGAVAPNPASWHRLNDSLVHMGMAPSDIAGSRPTGFYAVCTGFIGNEAGIAFSEFVSKYETKVTAGDVLNRFDEVRDRVGDLTASDQIHLIEGVALLAGEEEWTDDQLANLDGFSSLLSDEQLVNLWTEVSQKASSAGLLKNVQGLHSLIGQKVVEAVQSARQ